MKFFKKDIIFVSLFGLFLGASTTMIYSQLSLFMKHVLHMKVSNIAILDGIVELISYVTRVFAGVISDSISNRKIFLLIGSIITLSMKPVFALAQNAIHIFIAQSIERIGNGLQASPRDALVAELSEPSERATVFGFNKCLKTIGALIGVPVAVSILYITHNNYRILFALATVAVAIGIFCLVKTQEKRVVMQKVNHKSIPSIDNIFKKDYLKLLDTNFWKLIVLATLCEAGHFSEHLLPLYANNFLSETFAGTTGMFISVGQVLFAIPMGIAADRLGKGRFIIVCIFMMIAANTLFFTANSIYYVYCGCVLWGAQITSIQGLFLSIISEKVPTELRATAIGIYYCSIGASYLLASTIAGNLWNSYGCKYVFIYSICMLISSFLLFPILYSKSKK